jgi:hypothetical protein
MLLDATARRAWAKLPVITVLVALCLAIGTQTAWGASQRHKPRGRISLSGQLTNVLLDTDYTYNVEVVSAKSYRHALVRLDVLPSECFISTWVNVVAGHVWRKSYTVAFLSTYMMSTDGLDIGLFAPPSEYGHLLLGKAYPVTPAPGQVPNPAYSTPACSNPLFGS